LLKEQGFFNVPPFMQIRIEATPIEDVKIVQPEVFQDARGFFTEVYRQDQFKDLGLPPVFAQLNHSRSAKGVLRGLHFQWEPPMGKLMRVTQGTAFLVAVDIRKGSPTLGKWFGRELSSDTKTQIWAPAGFARGFCVLSDFAEIEYLCSGVYNSGAESGFAWNDPELAIPWPVTNPTISGKDAKAQSFAQWLKTPESDNFKYTAPAAKGG
jgi:dTDP-4-dehydrorhamnose 3,5-epimerase